DSTDRRLSQAVESFTRKVALISCCGSDSTLESSQFRCAFRCFCGELATSHGIPEVGVLTAPRSLRSVPVGRARNTPPSFTRTDRVSAPPPTGREGSGGPGPEPGPLGLRGPYPAAS